MPSRRLFCALLAFCFLILPLHSVSWAQNKTQEAATYVDTVDKLKELSLEDQITGWRKYLQEHPDTAFRDEIEKNVRTLEQLLTQTDPKRKKEDRDTERYLRATEFSKKLNPSDQQLLWHQFLEENPESIYRREAETNLRDLRNKYGELPALEEKAPDKVGGSSVAPSLAFKDKQTATLLATFPGLIVPGIAHWYTKDYLMGGLLTGLRVGGLAMGIPGIIEQNNMLIVLGSILAGFSYIFDIVDAPHAVERYNESLEQKKSALPSHPGAEIVVSISF